MSTTKHRVVFGDVMDGFATNNPEPIIHFISYSSDVYFNDKLKYIIQETVYKLYSTDDQSLFVHRILESLVEYEPLFDEDTMTEIFDASEAPLTNKRRVAHSMTPQLPIPSNHLLVKDIVVLLQAIGLNIQSDSFKYYLFMYWDTSLINACIELGMTTTDWLNLQGQNLAMIAAKNPYYSTELLEILYEHQNVPMDVKDNSGRTVMLHAGSMKTMTYLLNKDKDSSLHDRDNDGYTLLHHISTNALIPEELIECITYLVSNRLNINDKDNVNGYTPLVYFFLHRDIWKGILENIAVVKHYIQLFADLKTVDKNNKSLHKHIAYIEMRRERQFLDAYMTVALHSSLDNTNIYSRLILYQGPRIQKAIVEYFLKQAYQNTIILSGINKVSLPFDLILRLGLNALPEYIPQEMETVKEAVRKYECILHSKSMSPSASPKSNVNK